VPGGGEVDVAARLVGLGLEREAQALWPATLALENDMEAWLPVAVQVVFFKRTWSISNAPTAGVCQPFGQITDSR